MCFFKVDYCPSNILTHIYLPQELDQIANQEADELAEEAPVKSGPRPKKAKYEKESFQLDSSGR